MASIKPYNGGYRAAIDKKGVRASQVFDTKKAATDWATAKEAEILAGKNGNYPRKTFAEACDTYLVKISPSKSSEKNEIAYIKRFKRMYPALMSKQLAEIRTPDLADWRDLRLNGSSDGKHKPVSQGTVRREMNFLRNIFTVAKEEWKWCGDSPFIGLRNINDDNPARTRLINRAEIKRICRHLGYVTGKVETKQQEVAAAFLIALRTGLRLGELQSLRDTDINLQTRVLRLGKHKTVKHVGVRSVPFTRRGSPRLLASVMGKGKLFSCQSMGSAFTLAKQELGMNDLHFHDTRGTCFTRLSKKMPVQTLQKISGHTNINTLIKHYYRDSIESIAAGI